MEIKDFLIDEESTMVEAMEQLDKVSKKIIFVTRNGKFIAAITNGDIRRWILKKGNIDALVKDIANYKPRYLMESEKSTANEFMKEHFIEGLPILNSEKEIVSIVLWNEEEFGIKRTLDIPVVIMAGGLGTRLYPYTKILPKPLIPIGEMPIVEHIINRFVKQGGKQFHLIVNHKKNMIKAYFNEVNKHYTIDFIDEDEPLGTGGGLSLLKGRFKSAFVLSNCDILIKEDYEKIYKYHVENKNLITMVCSLKNIKIPYGVIEINENGEIDVMKEKPEISFLANTGMYIVEPKVIEEMDDNTKIGFPDIIEKYKSKGEKISVFPISEKNWLDMGQLDEMEEMRRKLENEE
ncbi:sugar phosphate nucleotidyltransferase [Acetobacterium carbinolicum]|uniref:sugar phosphate nucleotidyltransferase n=1 Tax=Acetobacterium carbinolicum TaxID=52690 RepID=UPI0039BFD0E6